MRIEVGGLRKKKGWEGRADESSVMWSLDTVSVFLVLSYGAREPGMSEFRTRSCVRCRLPCGSSASGSLLWP